MATTVSHTTGLDSKTASGHAPAGPSFYWDNNGVWQLYDDEQEEVLADALANAKSTVTFSVLGVPYTVNFSRRIQTNNNTGFQRAIWCTSFGPLPPAPTAVSAARPVATPVVPTDVFVWQDDAGNWTLYDKACQTAILTALKHHKPQAKLNDIYTVDLSTMRQINVNSKKERVIRMIPSSHVPAAHFAMISPLMIPPAPSVAPLLSTAPATLVTGKRRIDSGTSSFSKKVRADSTGLQMDSDLADEIGFNSDDDEDEKEDDEQDDNATVTESVDVATLVKDKAACSLCLEDFALDKPAVKLTKCSGHFFHVHCGLAVTIEEYIQTNKKCPTCGVFYGQTIGNMPRGKMIVTRSPSSLPGYSCGTIEMNFHFPGGIQTARHQHPGRRYEGDARRAYLPDDDQGQEVLKLFVRGWKQKLLFTIGLSQTRHQDDVVIFNGIHMKTSQGGGPINHGYPDPTYFERVKDEFAAKGIK